MLCGRSRARIITSPSCPSGRVNFYAATTYAPSTSRFARSGKQPDRGFPGLAGHTEPCDQLLVVAALGIGRGQQLGTDENRVGAGDQAQRLRLVAHAFA